MPLVQISAKSANLQQNLCNKPRGSGEEEIYGFPGFERHWSRFQRKASIGSKIYVINRVVPERRKLLEPNRRILYYWRRPEGFFTRILYYWRRTEGFFTIGADQKDSLLLAPNRRILYSWNRTEGFFTIGAEQKDSLLLEPNRRILYCWRRTEGLLIVGAEQKDSLLLEPNKRILYKDYL